MVNNKVIESLQSLLRLSSRTLNRFLKNLILRGILQLKKKKMQSHVSENI